MTPNSIDEDVKKLIKLIGTNTKPFYLEVTPEKHAQVIECFPTVRQQIEQKGGHQVLGWQIWKTEILVEGEFHAIWKSPEGELRDITPKQIPLKKILFLSDPKAKYNGTQVDNIRLNITNNRLVDDFIGVSKAIYRFSNKGDRAFEYELNLNDHDARQFEELNELKKDLYAMIKQGSGRNSPCFCNSGTKYKHCHGHILQRILKHI